MKLSLEKISARPFACLISSWTTSHGSSPTAFSKWPLKALAKALEIGLGIDLSGGGDPRRAEEPGHQFAGLLALDFPNLFGSSLRGLVVAFHEIQP